jgi:hypothetical protein
MLVKPARAAFIRFEERNGGNETVSGTFFGHRPSLFLPSRRGNHPAKQLIYCRAKAAERQVEADVSTKQRAGKRPGRRQRGCNEAGRILLVLLLPCQAINAARRGGGSPTLFYTSGRTCTCPAEFPGRPRFSHARSRRVGEIYRFGPIAEKQERSGLVQHRASCGSSLGHRMGGTGKPSPERSRTDRLPVGCRMVTPDRRSTVKQVWRCHPSRVLPGIDPGPEDCLLTARRRP